MQETWTRESFKDWLNGRSGIDPVVKRNALSFLTGLSREPDFSALRKFESRGQLDLFWDIGDGVGHLSVQIHRDWIGLFRHDSETANKWMEEIDIGQTPPDWFLDAFG